ncbi:MAG TPA: methylenetetrahydrofolate reductase [NAD(P)H] [Chitinophagales bacterium]|nr:methylenetetrahydrofolate reductase [NAD(P)H] [Chitinophagales bacterium]
MKVIDHINNTDRTLLSFEILPPLKGKSIQGIYDVLDPLAELHPAFVNVTYHRSEYVYKKRGNLDAGLTGETFEKIYIRKRPGTVGICAAIQFKYKIDAVAHLICGGFSKEETEDALIDLWYLSVENVLLLRGDSAKNERHFTPDPGGHKYAIDLVNQAMQMNKGIYLEDELQDAYKTNFNVGVAGYPEKHFESPNIKSDLKYLKAKVDAGASYIVTQMFFDNKKYFDFVNRCRAVGITVPIIPGIKPITSASQIQTIPSTFHVDIPEELSDAIDKCKTNEDVKRIGSDWCIDQSKELLKANVPCIHYYTMGKADTMKNIIKAVF